MSGRGYHQLFAMVLQSVDQLSDEEPGSSSVPKAKAKPGTKEKNKAGAKAKPKAKIGSSKTTPKNEQAPSTPNADAKTTSNPEGNCKPQANSDEETFCFGIGIDPQGEGKGEETPSQL